MKNMENANIIQRPKFRGLIGAKKRAKETPIKESVGIACCRFGAGGKLEILLIEKRYTYEYTEFVSGKYLNRNGTINNDLLMKMLNGMTPAEKLDICSLDFNKIWYRIWLNTPHTSLYFHAKSTFENNFLIDGGAKILKMIERSHNGSRVWEIPKGRRKIKNESDLNCAIREFQEETRMSKREYKLLGGAKRTYSFVDYGVCYKSTYFIAVTNAMYKPQISFRHQDQIDEVGDIRWMSMDEIRLVDKTGRLEALVRPIFNYVRKHTRI